MTIQQAIKKLEQEYPHGTDLVYIDYRDELNEEHIQELVTTGYMDSLYEEPWLGYAQYDSVEYAIKEIFTDEEQNEIFENDKLSDAIRDWMFDHDTSTPERDLIKNTGSQFLFYDLGMEIEQATNETEVNQQARRIARKLKIDYQKHKSTLYELIANAYYGGTLCVLFVADDLTFLQGEIDMKYITFKNPYICIMEREGGSGMDTQLGVDFTFKFIRSNLHTDEGEAGSSYSGDVCGLVKEPYQTDFDFTNKTDMAVTVKKNTDMEAMIEQEKEYEKTYKQGKCTFGDMKYNRHRNQIYINNFPCGNKCQDCGTFWID